MPSPDLGFILDLRAGRTLLPALQRRLDELALSRRTEFNRLIDGLSRARGRDIDWWVSFPASRNTHASNLFGKCVQLALISDLINEGTALSVYTDDAAMARVLRSAGCKVVCKKGMPIRIVLHNIASSIFHAFSARRAARATKHLARALPERPGLLEVYVQHDSFIGGVFRDRYYPGMYDGLSADLRARLFYLPIFYRIRDYDALFRVLRRAPQNFMLREDYLTWDDYCFAFRHWWRARRLKGMHARFAGFEIGPLLDSEIDAGRFTNATIQALLAYRFWRYRVPVAQATLVDWYEGHEIDHATAAAIRWHGGQTRLLAMRPIAPSAYLSLTPTIGEIEAETVAQEWAVVGEEARAHLRREFPILSIETAPGLRHRTLGIQPAAIPTMPPTVLVMLSLEKTFVAQVANILRQTSLQNWTWLIRRHPGMSSSDTEWYFRDIKSARFHEGDYAAALAEAAVVAGSGTNTLLEASAMGVPVICLASGNLPTELPFSAADDVWWRVAYGAEEFITAVQEALRQPLRRINRVAERLGPFDPAILTTLLLPP